MDEARLNLAGSSVAVDFATLPVRLAGSRDRDGLTDTTTLQLLSLCLWARGWWRGRPSEVASRAGVYQTDRRLCVSSGRPLFSSLQDGSLSLNCDS